MLVEKKLRDVTKEEFKKWVGDHCGKMECNDCPFRPVNCGPYDIRNWIDYKNIFKDDFLNQKIQVKVPDILDAVERKYLADIIRPFRSAVMSIAKITSCCYMTKSFIQINTTSGNIILPYFIGNSMYKGMEKDRRYTIKELGL